jgi:hypothetical protein
MEANMSNPNEPNHDNNMNDVNDNDILMQNLAYFRQTNNDTYGCGMDEPCDYSVGGSDHEPERKYHSLNQDRTNDNANNNTNGKNGKHGNRIGKLRVAIHNKNKEEMGYYSFTNVVTTTASANSTVPKTVRNHLSFFATKNLSGKRLRNAVTGIPEDYLVGRWEEDLFFTVIFAMGIFGKNPYGTLLCYDSPEQYEKHFMVTVSTEVKEKWRKKRDIASQRLQRSLQKKNAIAHANATHEPNCVFVH